MPSEKSRYLRRNRGHTPPLVSDEIRPHLPSLGSDHLAELLWIRAQEDDILQKALIVSIALRLATGDWNKAKKAIDYALYFPDHVQYTEGGHGLILEEIKTVLQRFAEQGKRGFAVRIAEYAIERGREIADNFEDDWDWTSSLNNLITWTQKMSEEPIGGD